MHSSQRTWLLLPLFLIASLTSLVTPSSAGPCYVVHNTKPAIGPAYQLLSLAGAPTIFQNTIAQLNGDQFTVVFDSNNHLDQMGASRARGGNPHKYVIILQYYMDSPSTDVWLYLNNADGCTGVANGEVVKKPVAVRVAQINNP